ncbi:MAG: HAD-IIB family hydrolase [Desulfosalsimonadaceae bacterium]
MNNGKILLCSDLDRTIIPNGYQPESPDARPLLRRLAKRPELSLVYVTGRDTVLIADAVKTWELPLPDIAVGDVGTAIYSVGGTPEKPAFTEWPDWKQHIAADWNGKSRGDLAEMLADLEMLRLQEEKKQKDFKLSFYVDVRANLDALAERIKGRLSENGVRASVITSIDEIAHTGLVDVLPERATKMHAVYYIVEKLSFDLSRVVYAGDSGNDLPALTSGFKAVVVKNAPEDICRQAVEISSQKGFEFNLYLAEGGFLDMNGNYSAGVLEGLAYFMPEIQEWLKEE